MTLLLSCQSLCKSFGARLLFKHLSLSIFSHDRIGLIGPNGSGKSTLLKILAQIELADSGTFSKKRDIRIGYVAQSCDFPDLSVTEVLLDTLKNHQDIPHYEKEVIISTWLSKLGFQDVDCSAARLSGGWKKRLSLAKELILTPDLLLLDEPTNHLDLEGILWLEKFLLKEAPSYLVVSHDRYFLQHVTNRIIEIDPAYPEGSFGLNGSYSFFLEKKEEFLAGQLEQERSLSSQARRETDWLRRSPKARTTKSQARVDSAHELLDKLSQVRVRNTKKTADISFAASERETRKLVVAKNLCKASADRLLFQHLDFTLSPGTRMGLMGPNGSGKTTLLKLLTGELSPDQGTIKKADALQIVYFDQHRNKLPSHLTLREALSPHGDYVTFQGRPIHINGWCKRFLFSPDLLDMPIEKLSGGERARISIAHLMLQPADLLLLDEPTNDLDIATLETLEESLGEFPGAVVLITHDRCMLDRVCTVFLALGDPTCTTLYPDYAQWENAAKKKELEKKNKDLPPTKASTSPSFSQKKKLSYLEKKEYDQIESKITSLEEEVKRLNHLLEQPEVAEDTARLSEVCAAIALAENNIEQLYLRWEELTNSQP